MNVALRLLQLVFHRLVEGDLDSVHLLVWGRSELLGMGLQVIALLVLRGFKKRLLHVANYNQNFSSLITRE